MYKSRFLKEAVIKEKEITWKQVYNAIEVMKKKLRKKADMKGIYENFGQREVNTLKDKFDYDSRIYGSQKEREIMELIDRFDEWCMNYTG